MGKVRPLVLKFKYIMLSCVFASVANAHIFQSQLTQRIESTLSGMTLEQKVGQILMVDIKPKTMTSELVLFLKSGQFGNIVLFQYNLENKIQVKHLTNALQLHAPKLGDITIPMLISLDQEGGSVDRLKGIEVSRYSRVSNPALSRLYKRDPKQALTTLGHAVSFTTELFRALGINMNLAPVLDTSDNPKSFIHKRSFGSNLNIASKLGREYIHLLQKKKIIATAKHFPNLGETTTDSHTGLPSLNKSLDELWSTELVPFRKTALLVEAIMVGHMMVPQIDKIYPASISKSIIAILRNKIGFEGVILCDDIKMKALSDRYTLEEILITAINAGIDMIMMAWDEDKKIKATLILAQAVQNGKISLPTLDSAVRRVLRLKFRYL